MLKVGTDVEWSLLILESIFGISLTCSIGFANDTLFLGLIEEASGLIFAFSPFFNLRSTLARDSGPPFGLEHIAPIL